ERAMIHNVVDFRTVKVRDVMLPPAKVVALPPSASTREAVELGASSSLDRLPVITPGGHPDGLINILDILLAQNGIKPLHNFARRPPSQDGLCSHLLLCRSLLFTAKNSGGSKERDV